MQTLLETKGLSKVYDQIHGIHNINIVVEQGDIYGFLGPNGSGKTTTIRTILDLIHADKGSIMINGSDVHHDFENAIKHVGAIVETPMFYDYLSGRANLQVIANYYKNVSKDRINEVLRIVGLEQRANDRVKTYSLGMKQRLGIARALLHNPQLVILDEPTNGLDPQGMKEVRETIKRLATEEQITFFISTHLLNEVEQICNKVGILKEGKMIAQGKVRDLLAEDMETIEIVTEEKEAALKVAKSVDYIRSTEDTQKGILFRIDKGYSAQLTRWLIKNDINVKYAIPKSQSLEQYFFDITEGEE